MYPNSKFAAAFVAATHALLSPGAHAQAVPAATVKTLGTVTVSGGQPTSLPTQIPTTIEGTTAEQIERTINATDSEDAIKYFPSLLVRKRYIGDYNHAVLSSRASGTGNSARSAVYADGILLSNYLGNGATYTPRWGLVTPEEIERADVLYGPFSAAYPGNSVGAVVDYVTRMPTGPEGHAKVTAFSQPFDLYNTHATYSGWQSSASAGNRVGDLSFWVNANRSDSHGQPLSFPTKLVSSGGAPAGTVVTGAVLGKNRSEQDWLILGTGTEYHTIQDHLKIKLAYDISPGLRASYTLGHWANEARGRPQSYLRNAAGNPVYSGTVNISGRAYTLGATDFGQTNDSLAHTMHGLSLKSHTQGQWDWEVAASLYDYGRDQQRAPTVALPAAAVGGNGTLTDQDGTGWNTLALKGIWRPQGATGKGGRHVVDFGFQREAYALRILKSNVVGNWISGPAATLNTDVGGKARLQSLYAQDTWSFAEKWKAMLGARAENWQAGDGYTKTAASTLRYDRRSENHVSPKAALAYQWSAATVLKLSTGRAVRMPTVQELYGATTGGVLSFINDPTLAPEKSWTTELSAERDLGSGSLRTTLFHEAVRDSLYSQLIPGSATVSRVQNVDRIRTTGLELAYQDSDVFWRGLDLNASVTYANSRIVKNDAFPASVGKYQPRVPVWRATALASYRINLQWSASLGARASGDQFSTLDNSDPNGFAYQSASRFFTADLRLRWQMAKQWSAAFGIDNINNYQYWNFHPYPQRTYIAELKFAL